MQPLFTHLLNDNLFPAANVSKRNFLFRCRGWTTACESAHEPRAATFQHYSFRDGVLVIAATNIPWDLDSAIRCSAGVSVYHRSVCAFI